MGICVLQTSFYVLRYVLQVIWHDIGHIPGRLQHQSITSLSLGYCFANPYSFLNNRYDASLSLIMKCQIGRNYEYNVKYIRTDALSLLYQQ